MTKKSTKEQPHHICWSLKQCYTVEVTTDFDGNNIIQEHRCCNKTCSFFTKTFTYCSLCQSSSFDNSKYQQRHPQSSSHKMKLKPIDDESKHYCDISTLSKMTLINIQDIDSSFNFPPDSDNYTLQPMFHKEETLLLTNKQEMQGNTKNVESPNPVVDNSMQGYLDLFKKKSFSACDREEKDAIVRCCFPNQMNDVQQKYFNSLLYDSEPPVCNFIANSFSEAGKVGRTSSNSVGKYSNNKAMFHIILAQLASQLSIPKMTEIILLMNYVKDNHKSITIPSNEKDLQKGWIVGNNSIQKNLPVPKPTYNKNTRCTYTSLEDVIRYNCTTDRYPKPFGDFSDCPQGSCGRAREWLHMAPDIIDPKENKYETLYIKVVLWSDSATLFTVKDSSFHLCVATVGAPEGDHTGKWGYPLWIAPAGADTDHLVQALVQEINCLQKGQDRHGNPFYVLYRGFNQMVCVQVCPFTWICDKPEKAHITHTLGGSRSLYHLRYGYSIAYTCVCPSTKKLFSCNGCVDHLYNPETKSFKRIEECNKCYSFLNEKIKTMPDDKYPTNYLGKTVGDQLNGSMEFELKPLRLTFEKLLDACNNAFRHLSAPENSTIMWNHKIAELYMKRYCLNQRLQENLINCATNKGYYNNSVDSKLSSRGQQNKKQKRDDDYFIGKHKVNPQLYHLTNLPPIYNMDHFDMNDFVSAIGHQLFLGVTKTIFSDLL